MRVLTRAFFTLAYVFKVRLIEYSDWRCESLPRLLYSRRSKLSRHETLKRRDRMQEDVKRAVRQQLAEEFAAKEHTSAVPQRGVISSFADWRFDQYLTMRLLPLFYLLLVLGALAVISVIVAAVFYLSMFAGFIALGIAPLVFLVAVAVIRAALEYLVMAHRIMRIIERMDALPEQVHGLSVRVEGITDHIDHLSGQVDGMNETLVHLRPLLSISDMPRRVLSSLLGK